MADLSEYYDGDGAKAEDGDDYQGGGDFQPLPAGWYSVEIVAEEVKLNKKKNGSYLKLCLEVISEDYANRKIFPMITLKNPNATAEKIGKGKLGKLLKACDVQGVLKDSSMLIGMRCDARLTVKPAKGDFPADNDVTDFERLGSKIGTEVKQRAKAPAAQAPIPPAGVAPAAPAAPATPAAPAPAGAGKMPWERR